MKRFVAVLLGAVHLVSLAIAQETRITADIVYVAGVEGLAATGDSARATVIDLRHREPGALVSPATLSESGTLRIVLVGAAHAADWCTALAPRAADVLIIGPSHANAPLDLTVKMSDDAITAALQALADGMTAAELAIPAITKTRYDESALVQRHLGQPTEPDDATDTRASDDGAETPPSVITDPILERAVQVIQGLRALKRA
ncbi:hypothetical protein [Synoicihabitans lomoniglobus]|uniref:Uncharacterized protein n=1 Tax=Synoicihabitans lomoniglobus TaxID=2909285 RepID=A0AAF0CT03_9BACT|nr:hypothetical protein [Opitutaceae bacterium LMO-M01]WED67436.1 hypothetical protein PXH66_11305 [Opitutaceae bacterium LMO-M01]